MPEFLRASPQYETLGLRDLCGAIHAEYAKADVARAELLSKLRAKAVQQLPKQTQGTDPLLSALAALTPDEQREKFRQLLQRAMPWTPLNLTGGFGIGKDRYTCLVGVQDASEFKRTYGAMLGQCLPQGTGMTAGQIQFVESGTPGKLICFTELSGFPLPARLLQSLEGEGDLEP